MCDSTALWRVAFCSQLNNGLADIPSEMTALHAYFANSGIRGGWRKVGSVLGVSGAYARELARGEKSLTPAATVKWLSFTGRYREMYEVPACPDCGSVHTGRCHGKPIVDVVVLSDGERIVKRARKPRKRPAYHRPCIRHEDWPAFLAWKAERKEQSCA